MNIIDQLGFMVINGFVWGSIVSLIAVGLSLVFGLTEIVNMAHGDFYMLGAVIAWVFILYLGGFWLALIISPLLIGALGLIIGRLILKPAQGNFANTIIVTFGLSLVIQYTVLALFGGAPQRMTEPIQQSLVIFHSGYSLYRIMAGFISDAILLILWIFITKTKFGLWMRAVGQSRNLALSLGIPVERVYWITFGLGSALASIGGVLVSPIVSVQFNMGLDVLVLSFMAAIVGGLGNLKGTFIVSIIIAEVEGILSIFADPVYARVVSLLVISGILLVKPQGLFLRTGK